MKEKWVEMKNVNGFSLEALLRPNIRKLQPYSSARDEFSGEATIYLDANENPFPNGLNRYPDPHQRALKAAVAREKGVRPEQVFLGNGSDEAIDLLFRLVCVPGHDEAVLLPPTYGMYGVSAQINDVGIRSFPLSGDFQPEVETILGQVTGHSKLLFLCSPNNPTGNLLAPAHVLELLDRFPGLVVIDEAYIDFAGQPSWITRLDRHPNLVVLQTFSKAWGLAAIRLGMAFASAELIQWLDKAKPPYNLSELSQREALQALATPEAKTEQVEAILRERELLRASLTGLPFVQTVYPSEANFLLVKMEQADRIFRHLLATGTVVRNRSQVTRCEGCLRITVGRPEENRELLRQLSAYAKKHAL